MKENLNQIHERKSAQKEAKENGSNRSSVALSKQILFRNNLKLLIAINWLFSAKSKIKQETKKKSNPEVKKRATNIKYTGRKRNTPASKSHVPWTGHTHNTHQKKSEKHSPFEFSMNRTLRFFLPYFSMRYFVVFHFTIIVAVAVAAAVFSLL